MSNQTATGGPDAERDLAPIARPILLAVAALALIGSLLGLTLGRQVGGVDGLETILIASAGAYAVFLLVMLLSRPFQRQTWIAPLTSAFFFVYLGCGGLISIGDARLFDSFFVYLLWFYPLLVFARFVNVSRSGRSMTWLFITLALALAAGRVMLHPDDEQGVIMMPVYGLSMIAFGLLLEMFAGFREHWIRERERERGQLLVDEALRQREQRFRRLFSNAAAGIGWLSLQGECLDVNRTFGRIVGVAPTDLRGRRFGEFVDAADYDRWQELREDLENLREEESTVELRLRGDGGRVIVTGLSFSLVRNAADEAEAIAFVCLDNTRVRALENRLHHAQRLEAVGQLTGGIAHDFNNLLTVILGNAESLEDATADDEQARRSVLMCQRAAERGARLVQQLLAFSRQQELEPRRVATERLLEGFGHMLDRVLDEAIEVVFDIEPGMWAAHVDPAELENALLNLCINARDAMPDGGRLRIKARNHRLSSPRMIDEEGVPPGDYVCLAVIDSGTGIEAAHMEKLFEPFFTTKPPGRGTGLGLSMVYGFVRQSDGYMEVDSLPGQGTTFRIFLPRSNAAA